VSEPLISETWQQRLLVGGLGALAGFAVKWLEQKHDHDLHYHCEDCCEDEDDA
jgi:hypothetical protein